MSKINDFVEFFTVYVWIKKLSNLNAKVQKIESEHSWTNEKIKEVAREFTQMLESAPTEELRNSIAGEVTQINMLAKLVAE